MLDQGSRLRNLGWHTRADLGRLLRCPCSARPTFTSVGGSGLANDGGSWATRTTPGYGSTRHSWPQLRRLQRPVAGVSATRQWTLPGFRPAYCDRPSVEPRVQGRVGDRRPHRPCGRPRPGLRPSHVRSRTASDPASAAVWVHVHGLKAADIEVAWPDEIADSPTSHKALEQVTAGTWTDTRCRDQAPATAHSSGAGGA
jgi:hypothetical protein